MHHVRLRPPAIRRHRFRDLPIGLAAIATLVAATLALPGASASASTTLFADGFESGFTPWTSHVASGSSTATVVTSPVRSGSYSARIAGSTTAGSVAYVRKTLSAAQASLVVTLDLAVASEGAAGANVPILKLFTWGGNRIVTLYRQNQTGGQVWLQDHSTYLKTSGIVPLGAWTHVSLQVTPTGSSSATTVSVNGATVFSAPTNLGNDWPATIQVGDDIGGEAFTEYVDNVVAAIPGTAPPTATASPTPTATASPTPAPTSTSTSGWVNVVNDQFGSLTSIPSHWTLYNGPYGSLPGNCAAPSHDGVWGGALHLQMYYQSSGGCGAGWYTGGMKLASSFGSIDQRMTVTFRVVSNGVASHYIIPMRWPTTASWPAGGEEDYCERDAALGDCATFLHYSSTSTTQIYHAYNLDLSQWHTFRFQRLNHVVTMWVDNLSTPVWTYVGSSTTLPDTIKTVVLQQECLHTGCPSGTSGSEDVQISSIAIDNPAP